MSVGAQMHASLCVMTYRAVTRNPLWSGSRCAIVGLPNGRLLATAQMVAQAMNQPSRRVAQGVEANEQRYQKIPIL